jgi:hypothetical protein
MPNEREDGSKIKDGGSAFPVFDQSNYEGLYANRGRGMTLRDWLAGQAVIGLLAYHSETVRSHAEVAAQAYYLADAMLAERERKMEVHNELTAEKFIKRLEIVEEKAECCMAFLNECLSESSREHFRLRRANIAAKEREIYKSWGKK